MAKLNVKLLNRIKRHIVAEPKRYNQGNWGERITGSDAPDCGTRGCIAGWAVFLSVQPRNWKRWIDRTWEYDGIDHNPIFVRAMKLLRLSEPEANCLFANQNQKYSRGVRGVREACKKIDALIASRRANGGSKSEHT